MKKKYYWIIGIVILIIMIIYFVLVSLVHPSDSEMYCLLCRTNNFRAQCHICNDSNVNWSSEVIISDKFVDCIKYCSFIERTVKSSLPKNITCETMEYLCNNYLID